MSGRSRTSGPQSDVGEDAHVGNFVELKKTRLGRGSKANHLAYLGDATIGEKVNVGAGTITVQLRRRRTSIRPSSRMARSSAATRSSSRRSRSGAAPTSPPDRRITEDVPAGALAIARGRQVNKAGLGRRTTSQQETGEGLTHVRHRRVHRSETARAHSHRRSAPARIPRLRLGRRCGRAQRQRSRCAAAPASSPAWRTSSRTTRSTASTASATRAGPRTAARPRRTPIRTATAPAASSSSTTASSRTTSSSSSSSSAKGTRFVTETDTEIVAHLVEREMKDDGLENAVRRALLDMRGLFALVLISADDPDKIVAVRNGPPIVVGLGTDEFFVASDIPAILEPHARRRLPRRRGDGGHHAGGRRVHRLRRPRRLEEEHAGHLGSGDGREGGLQALHAQGDLRAAAGRSRRRCSAARRSRPARSSWRRSRSLTHVLEQVERVVILACGTSWHAALVGKFLIEELARVPVEVDYGSEFRYRDPIVSKNTLAIAITQSGETADTLAALREAKKKGARSIAICNVVGSMATRETDGTVYTHAGPEIGVASTKAFTSQLVALHLLARLSRPDSRHADARSGARPHLEGLTQLPLLLEQTLQLRAAHRGDRAAVLPAQRLPLSRPRHQLSDRARRRAEAEGNLVHPRRGLSGRRDEARADRAHRRGTCRSSRSRRTITCSRRCSATSRRRRPAAAR